MAAHFGPELVKRVIIAIVGPMLRFVDLWGVNGAEIHSS